MAAILEITKGLDAGKQFQLEPGRWLLGRGEDCDIRIQDNSISRHHAVITGEDGRWLVNDLGSQNGTFLDGQKIAGEQTLGPATRLRLGTVEMTFGPGTGASSLAAAPEAPEAPPPPPAPATPAAPAVSIGAGSAADAAPADIALTLERVRSLTGFYGRIEAEFGKVIVGQRRVLEELLIAIAANGHCLMVGLPGLAKTLMVSTLSRLLQLSFKRIQFTPDLMPSDIIGSEVLEVNEATGQKSFRFVRGPVFTNMVLADEINRTPPKTQAALLESMQERQVTVANNVFPLPRPFFVLATQNPLEQEGTYPLPEAQLDRFLFNILVDYPAEQEEEEIVHLTTGSRNVSLDTVITAAELIAVQDAVRDLPVSPHVVKYATRLVRASRPKNDGAPDFIREYVSCGAGPRAAQHLILAAKAKAVIHGEVNVSCQDVRDLALPVLRHRLFTNFAADSENITPDELIRKLVKQVPEPGAADYPAATPA